MACLLTVLRHRVFLAAFFAQPAPPMAIPETEGPSDETVLREVSKFLRSSDDPNSLTFKQVRLALEKSLGLPEGSLLRKASKAKIKEAVHSVMDEIEEEAEEEEEEEEELQEFEGIRPGKAAAATAMGTAAPRNRSKTAISSSASPRKKRIRDDIGGAGGETKRSSTKREANAAKREKKAMKSGDTGGGAGGEDKSLACVLGETKSTRKQVSVKTWKGNIQVDIREHYRKGEQEFAPGKKGISLNPQQWGALRTATQLIDEALDRLT